MVLSARRERLALLSERLLIGPLLTSVGLAVLLFFGTPVSAHGEMDERTSESVSLNAFLDPHVDAAGVSAARSEPAPTISEWDPLVGAAFCVFGMVCGLTLLAFACRVMRRNISYPGVINAVDEQVKLAFAQVTPLQATPTTLVIDHDGRVAARIIRQLASASILATLIADTLEEAAS